jgi:hypothetical protein
MTTLGSNTLSASSSVPAAAEGRPLAGVVQALAQCDAHLKRAVTLPQGLERAMLVAAGRAEANAALRAIEAQLTLRVTVSAEDARFFSVCRRMIDGLLRALEDGVE